MDTKKDLPSLFKQNNIFCHLNEKDINSLKNMAIRRTLKKGEIIALQGSEWRAVLLIVSGLLRSVILSPDGRRHIVTTWGHGQDFWSHTTFDDEPLLASLEVSRNSVVYQWPGEEVLHLILTNEKAARALLKRQTKIIRSRRQNIYDLVFNPATSRIAKLIVDQFSIEDNITLQREFTLEEMADMAATSPEAVCRILSKFQSEGLLKLTRASITIQNRKALEEMIGDQM
jgi:CRP/FNR family transcriptional regulator